MRRPISTYRLQIRPEFDLHAAAAIVDYLHDLGVDWLYLSPILKSEAGSEHGYDVTDHAVIDPARGGAAGLDAVASAAHQLGMGLLIDIVPNHMGVATPADNSWWWDVLAHGRESRYAEAFDIDWRFGGGRVRIPVLADPPPGAAWDAEPDALGIVDGELHYRGTRYPLAPGSDDDDASARVVHDRQHYELVHWRRADAESNYRRFFAVNTLAGIRVEVPWVFDESHNEIVRWIGSGLADGLRIDHPDGLTDPAAYLDRLAEATGGTYVVVEKILQPGERLPGSWATAGTTGYDALADIDRVLIDPAGGEALGGLDAHLHGPDPPVSWPELIHDTKRAVADGMLRSEVLRVARDLRRAAVDAEVGGVPVDDSDTADAIAELLACFPVYRSYLPLGADHLRQAAALARERRPDLGTTLDALLPALADPAHPAAIRFQQTSGMVMAKGVEDTAFYRYTRLGSLTEVGANPSEFSISVEEFHRRQLTRLAMSPATLTTLSTHDTKRGEDVRARIDVLSEMPADWGAALEALRRAAPLGDPPLEVLLWQAVIGAWPADRDRLHRYAEKSAREAGDSTSWAAPQAEFESRLHALIDSAFEDPTVSAVLAGILDIVTQPGWSNSLSAKLIQLTAPGVPDVYQGSELWETSLVDPDNRRPVDFDLRRRLLAGAGTLPAIDETGAAKLLVTARALRLRRDNPQLFWRYVPVVALGKAAENIIAFDRGGAVAIATRLPLGLARRGGWGDTTIVLAGHPVEDVITGRSFAGGPLPAAELLRHYPVALLRPIGR